MRNFRNYVTFSLILFGSLPGQAATPDPLMDAARNYQQFQQAAETTGRKLPRSGKAVRQALKRLSGYEPRALGSGWIAQGALRAAGDPLFRSGVAEAVSEAGSADAFAAQLEANPVSVMKIPGAGSGMRAAFNNIKRHDQYYDWLSGSLTRLASGQKSSKAPAIRAIVIPRPKPGTPDVQANAPVQKIMKAPAHSMGTSGNLSVVGRMMVLAALDIAGKTGSPGEISRAGKLLDNPPMTGCLSLARLNLGQCLAASRGKAEKQFCAGQHAVGEVSQCFDWILPKGY